MQFLVAFLVFGTFVYAEDVQPLSAHNPAYGYIENIGIPQAERIRATEELQGSRIVGGVPAALGQYPFQAGLLGDIFQGDTVAVSVCGGTLISASRVLTAAHCWFDGVHQAWRFTVVLGSIHLFSGGTRIQTSAVAVHPFWSPTLIRNDVAVIYMPGSVAISDTIAPVSLLSGFELFESFAGERAITVGFGVTSDDENITTDQFQRHVSVVVLSNSDCIRAFPFIAQSSNICTSGLGSVGFCNGDSGGPLIVTRDNRQILIGVSSFRSSLGCAMNLPSAYARLTSYMDFVHQHV